MDKNDIPQWLGFVFLMIWIAIGLLFVVRTMVKPIEFNLCTRNIEKYPVYSPYWEDNGGIDYGCYMDIDDNARVLFNDIKIEEK